MRLERKGLIGSVMVVLVAAAVIALIIPAAQQTAEKEEKQITEADLEQIHKEVKAELKRTIETRTSWSGETKYWLEQTFKSRKKSSSPHEVVKLIQEDLTRQVTAWIDQVRQEHTLTNEYEAEIIEHKSGTGTSLYVLNVVILVRLECFKLPQPQS